MNFNLPFLPQRTEKPRSSGITIMTDKGLSVREAENFTEGNAPYTDFVKMAFGTSLLIPSLESKLNIYRGAGIIPYFGGTLFEVFALRDAMDDYNRYLDRYGIEYLEVSDSAIKLNRETKLNFINQFAANFQVISQVTNMVEGGHLSFDRWIQFAEDELHAGASYIIVKESAQMPLYGKNGLATYLSTNASNYAIDLNRIIWDASQKSEQIELINLFGSNVNLYNIASFDVIALETKRLGLHSSTLLKLIDKAEPTE